MNEHRLRESLRATRPPGAGDARERARAVVRAGYAGGARSAQRRRRLGLPSTAAVAALIAIAIAIAVTPPGEALADWVRDLVRGTSAPPRPQPALAHLPSRGELLVSGPGGAWIVHRDGSRRRLGDYREATWSPQARFVGAVRGHDLVAVDPHGAIRWVLSRPGAIHDPRWSPSGYRVAYRAGPSLRVVAGDGSGDRLIARHVPGVAAAWRPGARHVLSYVDRSGTIVTRDVDTTRLLARLRPGIAVRRLQWSTDGRRLLVTGARGVRLLDGSGRVAARIDAPAGSGFVDAALSPGGRRIAVVARRRSDGRHDVLLATVSGSAPRVRSPIRLRGPIRSVTWSPDGRVVLADWPGSDQWLFLPFSRHGAASAVVGISAHFDPGRARPREGVRVQGWCCS